MENENHAATPKIQTRSLIGKLASVMAEISRVKKNGVNSFQRYNYATEADLVEEVRQKLGSRGVFIFTEIDEVTERDTGRKTQSGVSLKITRVKARHTFRDADSDESFSLVSYGEGEDGSDKGIYKALTGAVKYFISKNFLMSTGDDPENDEAEHKAEAKAKARTPEAPRYNEPPPPPEPMEIRQDYTPAPLANNQCRDHIVDVQSKTGPKKDGSTYTRYTVQTQSNGFFSTFDGGLANLAADAKNSGEEATITFKMDGRFKNLEGIRTASAPVNGRRLVEADVDSLPF
jgi:hypothetical protein